MKGSEQYAAIILIIIILRLIRTTRNQGILVRQQRQQYPCILSTALTTSVHNFNTTTVSLHTLNSNNSILAYSQQQKRHLCILSTATTVSLHTRNTNSILPYSQQQQQHPCTASTATASFHTLNSYSKTLTRGRVSPSKSVQWKMID